jgi:hypothetical protein
MRMTGGIRAGHAIENNNLMHVELVVLQNQINGLQPFIHEQETMVTQLQHVGSHSSNSISIIYFC